MFALQFELQLCNNCSQSQSTQRTSLRQWHYDEYSGNFCQHCIVCVEFWLIICILPPFYPSFSTFSLPWWTLQTDWSGKRNIFNYFNEKYMRKILLRSKLPRLEQLKTKISWKTLDENSKVFPLVEILGISDCHPSSVAFKCLWNEKVLFYFYEIKVSFLCLSPFMHE